MGLQRYVASCGAGVVAGTTAAPVQRARADGQVFFAVLEASGHSVPFRKADLNGARDVARFAFGNATRTGAAVTGGGMFGAWVHRMQPGPAGILRDSAALAALAGRLDIDLLPRRPLPGQEGVLSGRSVVLATDLIARGAATDPRRDARPIPQIRSN